MLWSDPYLILLHIHLLATIILMSNIQWIEIINVPIWARSNLFLIINCYLSKLHKPYVSFDAIATYKNYLLNSNIYILFLPPGWIGEPELLRQAEPFKVFANNTALTMLTYWTYLSTLCFNYQLCLDKTHQFSNV